MNLALYPSRVSSNEVLGDIAFVSASVDFVWGIVVPNCGNLLKVYGQKVRNRTGRFILVHVAALMRHESIRAVTGHDVNAIPESQPHHVRPNEARLLRCESKLGILGHRQAGHFENSDEVGARYANCGGEANAEGIERAADAADLARAGFCQAIARGRILGRLAARSNMSPNG
jgi:hypothetical protein